MDDVILITGPAGFVGFKTVLTALEAGYRIRAVVRRPEQEDQIRAHLKVARYTDRLEFAVLPVLTEEGVFDQVLEGVVAVLHIASPLLVETDEYERDIITPAILMATSLLHSALEKSTIRRVIITSSLVTLMPFEWLASPDDRTFTAKDLNMNPNREPKHPFEAYWVAKALTRIAVRKFVEKHQPHFEVIQLLPGVIIGPDERAATTGDLRNKTPQWTMRMSPILGERQSDPMGSVPVDVGDVARAHVDAIKPAVIGNTDYTLCSSSSSSVVFDDMIQVAEKYFPQKAGTKDMPLGGTLPTMKWNVDSTETEGAFGWKFKTFEDTMKDMIGQYVELLEHEETQEVPELLEKCINRRE